MRRSLALLVVFGLAFVTKAQEGTQPHAGNIQGTWRIVRGQDEGKRVPESKISDSKVVITGDTIRITTGEHAAETILWPALAKLLPDYPDVKVEIFIDYGLTDIVAGRYDAGVRFGEQVAKDMVAVRIGPDVRMAVVGAPSYFAERPRLKMPQDLTGHVCINLRLPTLGPDLHH